MSKEKKLQIIPSSELKNPLNSLLLIAQYKEKDFTVKKFTPKHQEFLERLCRYGPIDDIVKIFGKNILKEYEKFTMPALLYNLCLSREEKNGVYRDYDKNIAKNIKDIFGIKNIWVPDNNKTPGIIYQMPGEHVQRKIQCDDNIKTTQIAWAAYTKASGILYLYKIGKPIPSHKIIESFLELIASIDQNSFIIEIFCDYTNIIKSITTDILNAIVNQPYFKKSMALSQKITEFLINTGNIKEAYDFLNITCQLIKDAQEDSSKLDPLDKKSDLSEFIMNHYWNLGIINKALGNLPDAEICFKRYYEKNPNCKDAVLELYVIYSRLEDKDKSRTLAEEHKDSVPHLLIIDKIINNAIYPPKSSIIHLSYQEKAYVVITAFNKAIYSDNKAQTQYYKQIILKEILRDKEFKNTCSLAKQIKTQILCGSINFNADILKQLPSDEIPKLLLELSIMYSSPSTYKTALEYINLAREYDPNNLTYLFHQTILTVALNLINQYESLSIESQSLVATLPPVVQDLPTANAAVVNSENTSAIPELRQQSSVKYYYNMPDLIEACNTGEPNAIHQYFQEIKQKSLHGSLDLYQSPGWYINETTPIKSSEATNVLHNLYAIISPTLKEQLNDDEYTRWQTILEKGFAKNDKGAAGIKFLKGKTGKIYELKDPSKDARLMAAEIYKNKSGESLILFKGIKYHGYIRDYLDRTESEIIPCEDYYELMGKSNHLLDNFDIMAL